MELKEMTVEQLEERKSAIPAELDTDGADLDALEAEVRSINDELESRKAAEAQRVEIRAKVAEGAGEVQDKIETVQEDNKMDVNEIRSSKEYVDAFANYIKSEDDSEVRKLLSENIEGPVPVPTVTEGRIRTAWERSGLMELVRKTYVRGNLRIGFELSATGADVHVEGADPLTEEELTFGIVSLIPQSIKKWIRISDEVMDLAGQEFLDYIYDEVTYQIAKKAEAMLIGLINDAPTTATAEAVSVAELSVDDLGVGTIATALGLISGDAASPVIATTRANWSKLKVSAYGANYAVDPFEGLKVVFVPADALGDTLAIVGDFGYGAQANFPNGGEIRIKFDDLSEAEADLVKIVGREFVALALVADKAFVRIVGGGASE